MKFIVIGLGNFGSSLGVALMEKAAEVIGTDLRMDKVELYSKMLTYTVCVDTTDEIALRSLPLKEADYVIVSIGEDVGASLTTTALVKKNTNAKILARAISPVHETILRAMGIEKIVHPEASFAKELANSLCLKGAVKTMLLDKQFEISEVMLPDKFAGKTILELDLRKKYNINIVTVLRQDELLIEGQKATSSSVLGVVLPETKLVKGDILVFFGKNKDIEDFMNKYA
jgi:trk system potassium uptake protein TrkA